MKFRRLIYLVLGWLKFEHEITLLDLSPEAEKTYCGVDNETATDYFFCISTFDKMERLKKIVPLIVRPYLTPLEIEETIRHLNRMFEVVQERLGEEKDEATSVYVAAKSVLGGTDV